MVLTAEAYRRMLVGLLPPGRLRLLVDGVLSATLLGSADELLRLDATAGALLAESVPVGADQLLEEYERDLDLEAEGTDEERLARVVARWIARQRYRPVDFQTALAPLLGQPAEDIVVIETSHALAVSMGDDREIFRFSIYRDPNLAGSYDVAGAQDLVDAIKPSHTQGHVIESVNFLCDDPFSLTDRDLLGV